MIAATASILPLQQAAPPALRDACPATTVRRELPIIDLRGRSGWSRRLPEQLLTVGLWGAGLGLLGPLLAGPLLVKAVAGLGAGGTLIAPWLRRLAPRRPGHGSTAAAHGRQEPPPRQGVALALGVRETTLFRARHAQVCVVHHDGAGAIVAISLPRQPWPAAGPERDAHPVG